MHLTAQTGCCGERFPEPRSIGLREAEVTWTFGGGQARCRGCEGQEFGVKVCAFGARRDQEFSSGSLVRGKLPVE
jgi:hypothetical protein